MTTKKKKSQGMKLFLMILPFLICAFCFVLSAAWLDLRTL